MLVGALLPSIRTLYCLVAVVNPTATRCLLSSVSGGVHGPPSKAIDENSPHVHPLTTHLADKPEGSTANKG